MQADTGGKKGEAEADDKDSDSDEEDSGDEAAAHKGQSRLFFEGVAITMSQVKQWGSSQIM